MDDTTRYLLERELERQKEAEAERLLDEALIFGEGFPRKTTEGVPIYFSDHARRQFANMIRMWKAVAPLIQNAEVPKRKVGRPTLSTIITQAQLKHMKDLSTKLVSDYPKLTTKQAEAYVMTIELGWSMKKRRAYFGNIHQKAVQKLVERAKRSIDRSAPRPRHLKTYIQ